MYIELYKEKVKEKKFNINIKTIVLMVLLFIVTIFFVLYNFYYPFRKVVNNVITIKTASDSKTSTIYIQQDSLSGVFGYDKYFTILEKNEVKGYTNKSAEEFNSQVNITNPISYNSGKYFIVAENKSNRMYLFNGSNLIYNQTVDGAISKLTVNKNGYVAICTTKDGYRSVIKLYNPEGKELFTTYLATTYAGDICISDDNKSMVIAEIDTSGIKLVSNIKLVAIDKIQTDSAIKNLGKVQDGLISKIRFIDKDELIYITADSVKKINLDGTDSEIFNFQNREITNIDIELGNYIVICERQSKNIFSHNTDIIVVNTDNKEIGRFSIQGNVKELSTLNNVVCANIGQEVYFLTATGRPLKKYSTKIDVKNVIMYDNANMAALIYRNKIEIIYI